MGGADNWNGAAVAPIARDTLSVQWVRPLEWSKYRGWPGPVVAEGKRYPHTPCPGKSDFAGAITAAMQPSPSREISRPRLRFIGPQPGGLLVQANVSEISNARSSATDRDSRPKTQERKKNRQLTKQRPSQQSIQLVISHHFRDLAPTFSPSRHSHTASPSDRRLSIFNSISIVSFVLSFSRSFPRRSNGFQRRCQCSFAVPIHASSSEDDDDSRFWVEDSFQSMGYPLSRGASLDCRASEALPG